MFTIQSGREALLRYRNASTSKLASPDDYWSYVCT